MLVQGKHLFPLERIASCFYGHIPSGYYMDAHGRVYSTRGGKGILRELMGSHTPSGHYYSLASRTYRHDQLFKYAGQHREWVKETQPRSNDSVRFCDIDYVKPEPKSGNRYHSATLDSGIKAHGVIIGTVYERSGQKRIVLGSTPKVHLHEASWKDEIKRLALLKPGTKFVALQVIAAVKAGGITWE